MAGDPYSFMESGPVQAQSYVDAQNMNRLAMAKTQAETQHYQAQAQQEMQKVVQEKQQQMLQQKQQAFLQQRALETQGQTLKERAKALADAGMTIGSMAAVTEYSKVLDSLAKADDQEATAKEKQFKLQHDIGDFFHQTADAIPVGHQKAYEAAFDKAQELGKKYGIQLPPEDRNTPWTQEAKDKLKAEAFTMMQKSEEARKDADEKRKERQTDAQAKLDEARTSAERALAAERRSKVENSTKAGGKGAVRTPREDVKAVGNLIRSEFVDANLDDPATAAVAELVAADAQSRLAKNRGLSRDQALSQAYSEAKKNGMISSAPGTKHHLLKADEDITEAKFNPTKKEGKVTTTKPADATDAEWAAYKKEMGIK